MSSVKVLLAAILAVASGPALAQSAKEVVIPPSGQIDAMVEGRRVVLTVDPSAPLLVMLNPDAAARIGLQGGQQVGARSESGRNVGQSQSKDVDFGPELGRSRYRLTWFDRKVSRTADGVVNPAILPATVVRMKLRGPSGGASFSLPLKRDGTRAIGTELVLDGHATLVRFTPWQDNNLATASTGADLAHALGGELAGVPKAREYALDRQRPVRLLRTDDPLVLGGLRLSAFDVRVRSFRQTPEELAAPPDPDEIVVVGKGSRQPVRRDLLIGRRAMAACSELAVDQSRQTISLTCLPAEDAVAPSAR